MVCGFYLNKAVTKVGSVFFRGVRNRESKWGAGAAVFIQVSYNALMLKLRVCVTE